MKTLALSKLTENLPMYFDDFFSPWNERFDKGLWGKFMNVPAVNITEFKNEFQVSLAAPGLKKEDFKIEIEGDMLTISCEKVENTEELEQKYTRKEYNYTSFSRSFTLPVEVNKEKIEATYEDGILKIFMPRTDGGKMKSGKMIKVK